MLWFEILSRCSQSRANVKSLKIYQGSGHWGQDADAKAVEALRTVTPSRHPNWDSRGPAQSLLRDELAVSRPDRPVRGIIEDIDNELAVLYFALDTRLLEAMDG